MTNYTPDFGDGIRYEELTDVTVDELERMPLPCTADLYDGKVVFKLKTFAEGVMSANIGYRIGMFLESHPYGYALCNLNFRLGPDKPRESRAPDVALVLKENVPKGWNRFLPYAPDMAIEILSPNDSFEKMMEKVDEYLTAGVKLVWVVIVSTREVMVCSKDGKYVVNDKLTAPELLPGFELPTEAIFAGLEK